MGKYRHKVSRQVELAFILHGFLNMQLSVRDASATVIDVFIENAINMCLVSVLT